MSKTPYLTSTALAGLLLAPSALAADLSGLKAPPATPTLPSWTGPYLGFNVGLGWASDPGIGCTTTGSTPCNLSAPIPAPKPRGLSGGLLAGYNWQVGTWVLGVESDISALGVYDDRIFPSIDPNKSTDRLTSRYDWLGTVRGRAGYATGQGLFFATGGLAYGRVRHIYEYGVGDPQGETFSLRETRTGWTAGGGVELALDKNMSLKLEYLYVHLQKSNLDVSGSFTGGLATFHFSNNLNLVRAGLNYRF